MVAGPGNAFTLEVECRRKCGRQADCVRLGRSQSMSCAAWLGTDPEAPRWYQSAWNSAGGRLAAQWTDMEALAGRLASVRLDRRARLVPARRAGCAMTQARSRLCDASPFCRSWVRELS